MADEVKTYALSKCEVRVGGVVVKGYSESDEVKTYALSKCEVRVGGVVVKGYSESDDSIVAAPAYLIIDDTPRPGRPEHRRNTGPAARPGRIR